MGKTEVKEDGAEWKGWISRAKVCVDSSPLIYTRKIAGMGLRRPIGDKVVYWKLSKKSFTHLQHSMQHVLHHCSFMTKIVRDRTMLFDQSQLCEKLNVA